jgi:heme exporter protein D
MEIKIGLPCVYEQLCFWSGVGISVLFISLIAAVVISVWRDKIKQQKAREMRKKQRQKQRTVK